MPKDADAIVFVKENPDKWLPLCKLIDEATSQPIDFKIQAPQKKALDHILQYKHSYIVKYRQAKISTLVAMVMLNKVMYSLGKKGLLFAESDTTAKTLIERIRFAHKNLAESVSIPPTLSSSEGITWPSFASIQGVTAGQNDRVTPGMGKSPDVCHVTEFSEYKDQENFNKHFFPSVAKRKESWLVVETTPGADKSVAHQMWLNAMAGKGRFKPLFLRWFDDPTCTLPLPPDFRATNEELRLQEQYSDLTDGHIYFRRIALETEFARSGPLGFAHKYPFHPYDGWSVVGGMPSMPIDAINNYMLDAVPTQLGVETTFEEPIPGELYLVTVDGNSYGESGDMSSIKVWRRGRRKEVWSWSEREDPGLCANRAITVATRYNKAKLMVENNKAELVAACRARGYENLFWEDEHHPGWRATEMTKGEAVQTMVDALRDGDIHIQDLDTLQQLALWDGDTSRRITIGGKKKHHFDKITTVYMAAWYFRKYPLAVSPIYVQPTHEPVIRPLTFRALQQQANRGRRGQNILGLVGNRRRR